MSSANRIMCFLEHSPRSPSRSPQSRNLVGGTFPTSPSLAPRSPTVQPTKRRPVIASKLGSPSIPTTTTTTAPSQAQQQQQHTQRRLTEPCSHLHANTRASVHLLGVADGSRSRPRSASVNSCETPPPRVWTQQHTTMAHEVLEHTCRRDDRHADIVQRILLRFGHRASRSKVEGMYEALGLGADPGGNVDWASVVDTTRAIHEHWIRQEDREANDDRTHFFRALESMTGEAVPTACVQPPSFSSHTDAMRRDSLGASVLSDGPGSAKLPKKKQSVCFDDLALTKTMSTAKHLGDDDDDDEFDAAATWTGGSFPAVPVGGAMSPSRDVEAVKAYCTALDLKLPDVAPMSGEGLTDATSLWDFLSTPDPTPEEETALRQAHEQLRISLKSRRKSRRRGRGRSSSITALALAAKNIGLKTEQPPQQVANAPTTPAIPLVVVSGANGTSVVSGDESHGTVTTAATDALLLSQSFARLGLSRLDDSTSSGSDDDSDSDDSDAEAEARRQRRAEAVRAVEKEIESVDAAMHSAVKAAVGNAPTSVVDVEMFLQPKPQHKVVVNKPVRCGHVQSVVKQMIGKGPPRRVDKATAEKRKAEQRTKATLRLRARIKCAEEFGVPIR
eukprot:PhM_4_TR15501/c0_g1_i1/m.48381